MSKTKASALLAKDVYAMDAMDAMVLRAAEAHMPPVYTQCEAFLDFAMQTTNVMYDGRKMTGVEFRYSFLKTLKPKTIEYLGMRAMGIVPPSQALALIPKGFAKSLIDADPSADFVLEVFKFALELTFYIPTHKFDEKAYEDVLINLFKVFLRMTFFEVSSKNNDLVHLLKHSAEIRSTDLHKTFGKTRLPKDTVDVIALMDTKNINGKVMQQLFDVYKVKDVNALFKAVQ